MAGFLAEAKKIAALEKLLVEYGIEAEPSSGKTLGGAAFGGSLGGALQGGLKSLIKKSGKSAKERYDKHYHRDFRNKGLPKSLVYDQSILRLSSLDAAAHLSLNNNKNIKNVLPNIEMHRSINTGHHGQNQKMSNTQEDEIPVAPIPKLLSNTVPDHYTVKLKCRGLDKLQVVKGTSTNDWFRIELNTLNSPFTFDTTLDYLGTSEWKSLFQYYRILSNDITVTMYNNTANHADYVKTGDYYPQFVERVGLEFTDAGTPRLLTSRQMMEGKHNITTELYPPEGINGKSQYTFKHHYDPSSFITKNGHVTETGDEDRWTSISTGATHAHFAHVVMCENSDQLTTVNSFLSCLVDVTCEITVQFREVTDSILTTSQTS